jgi:ferric-dicitrate binding protein FerR (iron transport regulator)
MNSSIPDPAKDLISAFIEGELDEAGSSQLAEWLGQDPANPRAFRAELEFADLLEQSLIPHRRLPAFLNGLETRFHAGATADEFLEDLLPRLREVDERQAAFQPPAEPAPEKVVRFPMIWRAGISLAAAAAVAMTAFVFFGPRPGSEADGRGVAKLAQTSPDIVWSKPDGQPGSIEWELGSTLPAGASIRLESGTARIDLADGGVLTLEGPADVQLESPSEARLVKGNVLASVTPGEAPLTIRAPGMEYQVDGSTTGVRTLEGNKLEAAVLSDTGKVTAVAESGNGAKDAIGPKEALVSNSQDGLKELVPIDPTAYRNHLNLLAGITKHSEGVSIEMSPQTEPASPSPVVVALEKEGIEPQAPVRVDITPSQPLPLAHSRGLAGSNRPAVEPGKKLRSYVIDVGALPAQSGTAEYTEAFIEFDKPILGIAATPGTLDGSDAVVGTKLPSDSVRGLSDSDAVTISPDGKTLRLRIKENQREALASFRVFVQDREISTPKLLEDAAWAAPRVEPNEKPDLTGKAPDAKPQP